MINKIKNILKSAFPDLILRDGKPIKDLLVKPSAAINEAYEAEKITLLEKVFIKNYSTMTFDELDLLVSNYLNTQRKLGRFSTTTVRIYLSQRTDIIFDKNRSSFQDKRGRKFLPRFDFAVSVDNLKFDDTLSKYFIDIPVISEQPFGEEYIIKSGDINTYLGANNFVENVINLNDSILVDVQESNTELYNRITENGIVLNSSRNNYLSNLVYQTFPDIKKFMPVGSRNFLMQRDLTFDSIDASSAITEYNFYKKKTGSTIDNQNKLYSGLLTDIRVDHIDSPNIILATENFKEVSQNDYESVSFRDKNSAAVSSLVSQDIFALYSGISDITNANWFIGENGSDWNKGTSAIEFTNKFDTGIKIKGKYITEPLLANLDSGLVLYKETEDPRNTEYLLEFMIEDFEVLTASTLREETKLTKKIISNNNPFYFNILKKGKKDVTGTFKCSTYDGYGVVIKRSITKDQPNVFIVDGSSGMGEMAFEQEILALGSERVLAGAYIPLKSNIKYTCILQINENYGLKAIFKNEFNAEIGELIVGSGGSDSDYVTTYKNEKGFEEQVKNMFYLGEPDTPRKFKFISAIDENEFCSSFLDLAFTVAKSDDLISKVKKISSRIVSIDLNANTNIFFDFRSTVVGDVIEISGINYLVTNVYNSYQIEVDKDLPNLSFSGESWIVWRSLKFNEDYVTPNKAFFNSLIVSNVGIQKINNNVSTVNKTLTKLKFLYIKRNGTTIETIMNWNNSNGAEMIPYQVLGSHSPTKLNKVIIWDEIFSSNYYFKDCLISQNYQAIYLTQIGFDNLKSDYLRVQIGGYRAFLLKKTEFKQGYYLPVPYSADVTRVTYVDSLKSKSSNNMFTKGTHYEVIDDTITDIIVNPTYFQLFTGELEISAEIIGTGTNAEVSTIGSSKSLNKIYIATNAISSKDYFSVIINEERYFIKSINLDSTDTFDLSKKIEITLDRIVPLIQNVTVKLRKKKDITTDSNFLRFGYRYSIPNNLTGAYYWNSNSDNLSVRSSSVNLIKGEDFDTSKGSQISFYYLSNDIFQLPNFSDTEIITFMYDYRIILEERKNNPFSNFKPISTGSYLGIGFKSINNGSWRLMNLKVRKLLEKYSIFVAEMNIGDKAISNEDRLQIDLTTYSLNTNSTTTPLNGSRVFIYNFDLEQWEVIYENNTTTTVGAFSYLQYYDGIDKDDRPFDFGYWSGSNFISINNNFYPASYVNRSGNLYILIASRGKNEKNFNSNLVFGEARLFLDYLNVIWQRKIGVHLGNKLDLWVASSSEPKTTNLVYTLPSATTKLLIDSRFNKPIIKINTITAENNDIPINFELINRNKNLRFTQNEDLEIIFSSVLSSGNYNINYDYYPHLIEKQTFVDLLESHIDCLVRQFVPCFITINLGYYGNLNVNKARSEIYNYIRFSSSIDIDYIRALLETNGAILTTNLSSTPFAEIEEYDLLVQPIKKSIFSFYSLKPEKYFELKKENINLIKLG